MKLLACFLVLVVGVSGLRAQRRDPCDGDTTLEMRQCAARKYKQVDDELNKTYRLLMSKLDNEGHKSSLKTAQQAWLKYRDTNCEFVSYLYRGGSIAPVIVTDCMTNMTTARIIEMKDQIRSLEDL